MHQQWITKQTCGSCDRNRRGGFNVICLIVCCAVIDTVLEDMQFAGEFGPPPVCDFSTCFQPELKLIFWTSFVL